MFCTCVPFSFVELSLMHEAWNIFGILSSHKQVWCEVLKVEVDRKLNSIYADYVYILHYSWRLKGILTNVCWIRYWRTDSKAVWLWNILRLKLTKAGNYLQIHTVIYHVAPKVGFRVFFQHWSFLNLVFFSWEY